MSDADRAQLHRTIWNIANDLRGSVDGWDFKSYVLGMMFYRFISEKLSEYIDDGERAAGNKDADYASLSDKDAEWGRTSIVEEKGYFILPSELFTNVCKQAADEHYRENLNERLQQVFKNIEASAKGTASESDLQGLFDDINLDSNKLGNSVIERNNKIYDLMKHIGNMPLTVKADDNSIDLFGDAYEYLMGMYASQAGKSGGEYYTPQEVSELLTRITVVGKKSVNRVYETFMPRWIQKRADYDLAA